MGNRKIMSKPTSIRESVTGESDPKCAHCGDPPDYKFGGVFRCEECHLELSCGIISHEPVHFLGGRRGPYYIRHAKHTDEGAWRNNSEVGMIEDSLDEYGD